MQARLELLESQVAQLQREVSHLRGLLGVSEEGFEFVSEVRAERSGSASSQRPVSPASSVRAQRTPDSAQAPSPGYPLQGRVPPSQPTRPGPVEVPPLPRSQRDAAWLLRARDGEHRGASGRDRLPQGSKLWLVLRSYEGEDFDPPRVYQSFAPAKAVTKRGADLGQAILVGLPSRGDLEAVIASAGLPAPVWC